MKQKILPKKGLLATMLLSAVIGLTGIAIDGAHNNAAAQLTQADCRVCHNEIWYKMVAGQQVERNDTVQVHHTNYTTANGYGCNSCHNPQPPRTNPPTLLDCITCHSAAGHAADHDFVGPPDNTCAQCHDPNVVVEHVDNRSLSCGVCHDDPAYAQVIEDGKSGIQQTCYDCHTPGGHTAQHDFVGPPSDSCKQCHDPNVVVEHVDNRGLTCATCHDDPAYAQVIEDGRNGIQQTCSDCHTQNSHHDTTEAQAGNCTYCHADPRAASLGTTLPDGTYVPANATVPTGQLACRQCHGTNMHNKIAPGSPNTIQDYSACFACHQPTPFHPKPTSWPGWYGENQNPVGRGSFNLFYNELRPRCAGDCESQYEDRRNYGEDGKPARDAGRNWRSPSIDYDMVTFFDYFNTNKSWTVPTFGDATPPGGGTGGGNDSVTITRADYDSYRDRVRVYATNTLGRNAILSVSYNGRTYEMNWDSGNDRWERDISDRSCSDSTIEVTSMAGGSASSSVSNCSSSSYSSRY